MTLRPAFRTHRRPLTSPTDRVIARLLDADFPDAAPTTPSARAIASPAPVTTPLPLVTVASPAAVVPEPPPPSAHTASIPHTAPTLPPARPKPLPPDAHTCLLFTPDRPPRVLEAALRRKRLMPQPCHDPYTLLACAFAHVTSARRSPSAGSLAVVLCLPPAVSPDALPDTLLQLAITLRRLAPRVLLWSYQPASPVAMAPASGSSASAGLRPLPLNLTPTFQPNPAPAQPPARLPSGPPNNPPSQPHQPEQPGRSTPPSHSMPPTHSLSDPPSAPVPDAAPPATPFDAPLPTPLATPLATPALTADSNSGPTELSGKHPGSPPDRAGGTFPQVHTVSGRTGPPARAKPLPVSIVGNFLYFNPANSQESAMLLFERAALEPAPRQEPRP